MRSGLRLISGLVILFLLSGIATAANAQTALPEARNIAARVFTPEGNSVLANYAPDGSVRLTLDVEGTLNAALSTDNRWLAAWGYRAETNVALFAYRQIDGAPVEVPIEAGYDPIDAGFSMDNRYLWYVFSRLDPMDWLLGLIRLDTGTRVEFTASHGAGGPLGDYQMGTVLDIRGERVTLNAFVPYAEGNFGGLYALDVAGLETLAAGRYPLPTTITSLVPGGAFVMLALAADGNRVAYLDFNPANSPEGYEPLGPAPTFNRLVVRDLTTGDTLVNQDAPAGDGMETLAWAPDGQSVFYTCGGWDNTYYLVQPALCRRAIVARIDYPAVPLGIATADSVRDIRVCGDSSGTSLYFVTGDTAVMTSVNLNHAPLEDLAARNTIASGAFVSLQGCASGE